MKSIYVIGASIFIISDCNAEPGDRLIQDYPKAVLVNEWIAIRPIEKHHFSMKAPQLCDGKKFDEIKSSLLLCQVDTAKKIDLYVNVCNDSESYCKPHEFQIDVKGSSVPSQKRRASKFDETPKEHSSLVLPGFIKNDMHWALHLAQKEQKLLFVDFGAPWCPPCNMLDEYVFSRNEFAEQTKDFIKLQIDVDGAASREWKAKYEIGVFPTLLVLRSDGQEIARLIDYHPMNYLTKWMGEQKKYSDQPISDLKSKKNRNQNEKLRLARYYLDVKKPHDVLEVLKGSSSRESELIQLKAKTNLEKSDDARAELAQEFPEDPGAVYALVELMENDRSRGVKLMGGVLRGVQKLQVSPEEAGIELAEAYLMEAELLNVAGDSFKKEAQAKYSRAADAYSELASKSPLKPARGANLNRIYALREAGRDKEVLSLGKILVAAYPEEFTFNFSYARTLHKFKESKKALKYAIAAKEFSYGDNWLRSIELIAEIKIALNQKKAARSEIESALNGLELPRGKYSGANYTAQRLRKLLAKTTAS